VPVCGDKECSGLGVTLPLRLGGGSFELNFGDDGPASFCDKDCERCRNAKSEAFFLLS